jgi:two-component system sensor histidine kinase/response regulator
MGGSISVNSKMGQGSTFSFTTRCTVCDGPQKMTEARKLPIPHFAIGRLRILLAEDNRVNQLLTIRLLEGQGHEVVVVNHGRAALEALERERFDLVLMDVQMPEMDGLEATRILRQREAEGFRSVPIIAMTAHAMKGDRDKCLAAGMRGYISKPIQPEEFFELIEEVMGHPA